jgi:hypothetical protein
MLNITLIPQTNIALRNKMSAQQTKQQGIKDNEWFAVLTPVLQKFQGFMNATLCRLVIGSQRFEATYCLLRESRNSRRRLHDLKDDCSRMIRK